MRPLPVNWEGPNLLLQPEGVVNTGKAIALDRNVFEQRKYWNKLPMNLPVKPKNYGNKSKRDL